MKTFRSLLLSCVLALPALCAETRDLLYLAIPDGAQKGGSGAGVLIFDIAKNHEFVRRIDVPVFAEGVRGFCPNAATHRAFYSTTNHTLGCLDLETDEIVWEKKYPAGCDRAAVTPDGKKIYVPTGWWVGEGGSEWFVVDAANGEVLKHIPVGSRSHNTVMGPDGRFVYAGSEVTLSVIRTSDDTIVKDITPIGESGVFPFTIDSRQRRAFVCLGKHIGFDIADLETGKVLHRVFAEDGKLERRTHGIALTPDEKEIWISDQDGRRLYVFDATVMPPRQTGHAELTVGGHGWVTFSLDGRHAWCHTPDVIDAATKKIVATLKDGNGEPVGSSKLFQAQFRDGKVTAVGDQFGVGRAHAP